MEEELQARRAVSGWTQTKSTEVETELELGQRRDAGSFVYRSWAHQ
jgi:hypothetical protein